MGAIKMLHLSMMTSIIHVYSRSNEVCWLTSPIGAKMIHLSMLTCKSMSTYITQYLLLTENLKYVDLRHPWVQSKWSIWICWLAVCQLTSPSIFYLTESWSMFHLSMMTCIIHMYSRSNGVCWLASPINDLARSYEVCWLTSPTFFFSCWNPDMTDWYNWVVSMSMKTSWYVSQDWG